MKNKKKALIVVTNVPKIPQTGAPTGWYLPEVSHPYYALREAGIEVEFASPKGGHAPLDESSRDLSDPDNARFLNEAGLFDSLSRTAAPEQLRAEDYSAIVYAGGHGTMWDFAPSEGLARLAAGIYERGGVVAAVCHGPATLLGVRLADGKHLVSGKRVTGFIDAEESAVDMTALMPFLLETELRRLGARFEGAPLWEENVVVDGRLITGQNPASAKKLGKEVARALLG